MVTTYGAATLLRMHVWTDEAPDDAELPTDHVVAETHGDLL